MDDASAESCEDRVDDSDCTAENALPVLALSPLICEAVTTSAEVRAVCSVNTNAALSAVRDSSEEVCADTAASPVVRAVCSDKMAALLAPVAAESTCV